MPSDPEVLRLRSRLGVLARTGAPADEIEAARAEYATAALAAHIKRTVEAAPRLNDEQRARLADLFMPFRSVGGGAHGDAA